MERREKAKAGIDLEVEGKMGEKAENEKKEKQHSAKETEN